MSPAGDQTLAHSLRELVAKLNRSLRKQVSHPEQLSLAEENVVRALIGQEDALPSELCAQISISSQFMSQVLNRLESLEMISRTPSRKDRRKSLVSLSSNGMQKLEARRKQKEDWLASMLAIHYNKQEKVAIAKAVRLLARIYEDK